MISTCVSQIVQGGFHIALDWKVGKARWYLGRPHNSVQPWKRREVLLKRERGPENLTRVEEAFIWKMHSLLRRKDGQELTRSDLIFVTNCIVSSLVASDSCKAV